MEKGESDQLAQNSTVRYQSLERRLKSQSRGTRLGDIKEILASRDSAEHPICGSKGENEVYTSIGLYTSASTIMILSGTPEFHVAFGPPIVTADAAEVRWLKGAYQIADLVAGQHRRRDNHAAISPGRISCSILTSEQSRRVCLRLKGAEAIVGHPDFALVSLLAEHTFGRPPEVSRMTTGPYSTRSIGW